MIEDAVNGINDFFEEHGFFDLKSTKAVEKKKKGYSGIDYLPPYTTEFVESVLSMYAQGMPVQDIVSYTTLGDAEVHEILDHFAPYMGGSL